MKNKYTIYLDECVISERQVRKAKPEPMGFTGPMGATGREGATFTPHIENGVLYFTNDRGLENPKPVKLKIEE